MVPGYCCFTYHVCSPFRDQAEVSVSPASTLSDVLAALGDVAAAECGMRL
eukprot:CAMPEP_0206437870 /NCGR_PEP_ID=MMETSP0324_2-20121206/11286_1 /ASSEMBLY_ACC=CAM_ASM_000836 /TAXON_ID=2866 /ORGANISM="Crypthecodinium cohnii, Strain Seligo" /LENGTH=49 /DNA_ID= /DNA_START= /DNA_END= /DNA_ORIENTATION=